MGKMNKFVRWLYGVIGLVGVGTLFWVFGNLDQFKTMGWFANLSFVIGVVAMVNWGVVAITGKRDKDLFGLLML